QRLKQTGKKSSTQPVFLHSRWPLSLKRLRFYDIPFECGYISNGYNSSSVCAFIFPNNDMFLLLYVHVDRTWDQTTSVHSREVGVEHAWPLAILSYVSSPS
ncbi:unnamed protein product, partial [Ectocarpus sp. 12 AP-2014]